MKQVLVNLFDLIILIALMFLFWGEPDLFDKIRADLMGTNVECINPEIKPNEPTPSH